MILNPDCDHVVSPSALYFDCYDDNIYLNKFGANLICLHRLHASSSRAALDQDLDSILSGGGNDVLRMMIFTVSLAQMAGDGFDDDNDDNEGKYQISLGRVLDQQSLSEADAKKMADSLAGLDDMESDLFGGSLGKKSTPSKPSKPAKTASEQKKRGTDSKLTPTADSTKSKTTSASSAKTGESSEKTDTKQDAGVAAKPKEAQKPRKKFDFGEFDEDDPLAENRLSRNIQSKTQLKKGQSPQEAGKQPIRSPASVPSPPVTPEHQPAHRRDKAESGTVSSPPGSPATTADSRGGDVRSSQLPLKTKDCESLLLGKQNQAKKRSIFDSDEDLPGLDDSVEKTQRDFTLPISKIKA
ncbi:hypothetical protein OS493_034700 [Desmophyllum pertusum]|uniref:Uncharacterized protein n=1 Tax=Desmophyllum pertusum TaxID=174260 RepID=A0A9X0CW18_9CNID|nr:hypothetical protein OS493_034700 [Desmophyllum pertusum]